MTERRSSGPLGILGGTFDPIHFGHLRLGEEALSQLGLAQVRFIPAGQPPLRDEPAVSAAQRLEMVKLAIADNSNFALDDAEVMSTAQSYTVDTLSRLRSELGPTRSLVLLLGQDAFARLEGWHRWTELFELSHIAVASRPGTSFLPVGADETDASKNIQRQGGRANDALLAVACGDTPLKYSSALAKQVAQRQAAVSDLATTPSGFIVPFSIPALDISATAIRCLIKAGRSPRYLVADSVVRYIELHHLYR
jgi:nicotinate-nucleotide adenylyltransferase